ncbi:hypothetical protein [Phytohabitans houttuyneae]|uniref:Uncharacterized protein n=1 Tax=Phytohabitans houttuyneae TaxID=1076126 RepID=A0A6V8KVG6_9ACTN|nr:hypothetical protein [Phytohabitans houttuyneae]GFJ85787.1 hypothetical protein Phou_099670 [Phytohabitans houttuyneae]
MLLAAPITAQPAAFDPSLPGLVRHYGDLRADLARAARRDEQARLNGQAAELYARITAMLHPGERTVATDALAALNLRAYPGGPGDLTAYVVVDVHGVSIGVRRRTRDLYVHLDTTETPDSVLAVEVNGGGETDIPIW